MIAPQIWLFHLSNLVLGRLSGAEICVPSLVVIHQSCSTLYVPPISISMWTPNIWNFHLPIYGAACAKRRSCFDSFSIRNISKYSVFFAFLCRSRAYVSIVSQNCWICWNCNQIVFLCNKELCKIWVPFFSSGVSMLDSHLTTVLA